jgi:hypothetical protein
VPSQLHEILVMLFRNQPELAPLLLSEALHVELPQYSEVRIESAELSNVVPAEYRADLVVLLIDGRPVLGIVVEVQLQPDDRKRFSWPVYVAGLRARLECDCCLLIVTASSKTARWAATPITTGPGGQLTPLVLGPEGVPIVSDALQARRFPELAVLSVMAHGHGDPNTAVNIAKLAAAAASDLDSDRQTLYLDLIEAALGEAARKAFEVLPETYQFQGPSYLRGRAEGRSEGQAEGQARGQARGQADAVLAFLEARGIAVDEQQRQQILDCTDLERLHGWIRKAATLTDASELFEQ